jgi:two-component system, cell cycle sensor histidine kinase and response regulator CckA
MRGQTCFGLVRGYAMDLGFLEEAPLGCYLFRREHDEFVLEQMNAAVRQRNPGLSAFIGRPMAHLYSDQPAVLADALRCVNDQVVVEHELAIRRHDRTEATLLLALRFVPAPPDHLVLITHEVSQPDMAERALSESDARYQSLVDSLPDAVLLRGADGRVLFCNDVALKLFGAATQADLLGKRDVLAPEVMVCDEAGQVIVPDDVPSLRVLRTGQPERGQVYAFVTGEDLRWMRLAAQPIRSTEGRVTGSVTTFTDVTDRVLAQTALRDSAARLDLALASARMGVWEFEPAVDVGWWSPNLTEIFQLGDETPGILAFLGHLHPDDRLGLQRQIETLAAGVHGQTAEHEFRILGADGVTRWARVHGRVSVSGTRRVLAGTTMDITEQRLLEEQLHRASRLESIGRLAGGVAHDFNNLLAAMLGSLDLIDGQVSPNVSEDLATIRHSALRARDLTRQLLAFARKQPVVWRTVDLAVLVRGVELLLKRLVGPRIHITLVTSGKPLVSADAALLEQVLVNLVVNARDAMPDGGRLEIRVEPGPADPITAPHGTALLTVTDSGIGMDEATRGRLFEPFFTTKAQGTGLGLASSYGIIQQHRGDIRVESEQDRGTRFTVTLPCLAPGSDAHRKSVPPLAATPARGTVLVVDDEDAVRRTTARLVKSLGYDVLDAGNVTQALECSTTHDGHIDLLLCDIAMPGEDGRDLAAELIRTRTDLRVVFMSGYSTDMSEMRVEGAIFLQKPFSREELARKLLEAAEG